MGVLPWAGQPASPVPARWPGSDRAQFAWQVARAPYPLGGIAAAPRRRAHLGPQLRRDGHGLAPGARQPGLRLWVTALRPGVRGDASGRPDPRRYIGCRVARLILRTGPAPARWPAASL